MIWTDIFLQQKKKVKLNNRFSCKIVGRCDIVVSLSTAEMSADQLFDSVRQSTVPKRTTAAAKKPKNMFSFEDSDEDASGKDEEASSGSDYKPSPKSKRKFLTDPDSYKSQTSERLFFIGGCFLCYPGAKATASKATGSKRAAATKKPKYRISDDSDDDF